MSEAKIDIESRIEAADEKWESVVAEDRTEEPKGRAWWGFKSYGDAPAAIGGGNGIFVWKPTRDEVLTFIADVLPYSPPGQTDKDWDSVANETALIVGEMKAGGIDDDEGLRRLNETLVTFSQIEFLGTFEDLIEGDGTYARKIRAQYLNEMGEDEDGDDDARIYDEDGAEPVPAISAKRMDSFKEWLSEYGMF